MGLEDGILNRDDERRLDEDGDEVCACLSVDLIAEQIRQDAMRRPKTNHDDADEWYIV